MLIRQYHHGDVFSGWVDLAYDTLYILLLHILLVKHDSYWGWKSARWTQSYANLWNDLGFSLCAVPSICYVVTTSDNREKSKIGVSTDLVCHVISQTPKHVQDMFNFNTTSNPHGYLVLFVSKTPSVVWYFIMDLIPPKVHGYFALFWVKIRGHIHLYPFA